MILLLVFMQLTRDLFAIAKLLFASLKSLLFLCPTSVGRANYEMMDGVSLSVCVSVACLDQLENGNAYEAQNWQDGSPSHK